MTYLSAHMYRQISKCTDKTPKKHYGGGGGELPPPPSGYASDSEHPFIMITDIGKELTKFRFQLAQSNT